VFEIKIRALDVFFSLVGLVVLSPICLLVVLLGVFDTGAPIFLQRRVGKNRKPFTLIKFRTMSKETKSVATHLVASTAVTRIGHVLRKTKLDELPQLINVLKGDMSFVGPRPGLFNQEELTAARESLGVFSVRPGITGEAQVNNIDMSVPEVLAVVDARMISELSVRNYFKFIVLTLIGKGSGDKINVDNKNDDAG